MKKQKIPVNCGSDHNVEICLGESDPYCYHKLYLKSRFCSTCHLRCTWTPSKWHPLHNPLQMGASLSPVEPVLLRMYRKLNISVAFYFNKVIDIASTAAFSNRWQRTSDSAAAFTKCSKWQKMTAGSMNHQWQCHLLQTQLQHSQSAASDKRWLQGAWTTSGSVNVSGFMCSVNTLCLPLAEGEHSAV